MIKPHVARVYDPDMISPESLRPENPTVYGCWCWGVWETRGSKKLGHKPLVTTNHCAYAKVWVRDLNDGRPHEAEARAKYRGHN